MLDLAALLEEGEHIPLHFLSEGRVLLFAQVARKSFLAGEKRRRREGRRCNRRAEILYNSHRSLGRDESRFLSKHLKGLK